MPTPTLPAPAAPTPAAARRARQPELETPFGKIQPVFEGFSLATPGWMHEDSTLPSLEQAEASVRRSPRLSRHPVEQPPPPAQAAPTPRRSPRRSAWVDEFEIEQPTPRRSARRRTTVERLGFPSMGDSTRESLAASMARSRSISAGPSDASPSKPPRVVLGAEPETGAPEPSERETRTPAVAAQAVRQTPVSTSTPTASNDLYERRLLDSARRKTLLPLPGHDWADEGLASSTPAPPRAGRRKSFRPSPEHELVSPLPAATLAVPTAVVAEPPHTDSKSSEPPRPQTPPSVPSHSTPEQSTPENKFVLPPCVSTRKKRRMASPGKPLRTSGESVAETAPAESSRPAQPKFLDELSRVLTPHGSTPGRATRASGLRASEGLSSSSSSADSHTSTSSGKKKAKRTVIKIGAGGRIRTSVRAAELVAEQEESLRLEASLSLDRSADKPADKSGEIADWSRDVGSVLPAGLVLRRSESLQSSSSRLTRANESRSGTPVSLASLSDSPRGSLPPRPQNPTPRSASPRKEGGEAALPARPAAPAFASSTSEPKRPSNPTPTRSIPVRAAESPAPTRAKLNKSAGDAEKPKQPLDRPIKRFPVRKAVPAPQPAKATGIPAAAKAKPLNQARKRLASDPPAPIFPARVRNGPPVLTPAKAKTTAAAQPKTRLPVPSSEERGAKRARVAAPEPEETGSTTPPHVVEALATPRRHSVTVRRTPRRTTPRRTPAPGPVGGWPELGISAEQGVFTFEHRLRQAADDSVGPPSVSYPTYPSARRGSYVSDPGSESESEEEEEQEEEGEGTEQEQQQAVGMLDPQEEFEAIRPHGQELSAVLEVTEGEVSALSQRSALTPLSRPANPAVPLEVESEDEYEEEPTPRAIVVDEPVAETVEPEVESEVEPEVEEGAAAAAEPAAEEQDADTSASSSDSSLRRLGEGVLGFLAGLVGPPTTSAPSAPAAAPAPASVPLAEPPKPSKPTRVIRNKPSRAKGKENASAPRPRPATQPQSKKDVPRYALATAAARAHEQQPEKTEKRKRGAGSPQRNVRRKVPAAASLPAARPIRSLPGTAPIRSLPNGRSSSTRSASLRSVGTARSATSRSVSATSAASSTSSGASSSSRPRGPRHGSTVTAFTAAALARLPKPGETKAKASPVKIRDLERARDLAVRKAVFERFHPDDAGDVTFGSPAPPPAAALASASTPARAPLGESAAPNVAANENPIKRKVPLGGKAKLTVPMSGKTPGKASKMRAASRARFDAKVARKAALKAREDEERERIRRQVEDEMDRERRRATVIRARPLPEMYRK